MEDKIEIGEYVRTKEGIIDEVIIEYNGKCNNSNCNQKHISCKYNYYNEKDIVKHSKQLKDLIECGDFVNGYKVISVDYDVMNDTTECIELDLNSNYQYNFISIRQIQTILTKESYMANCYKVGGEDE